MSSKWLYCVKRLTSVFKVPFCCFNVLLHFVRLNMPKTKANNISLIASRTSFHTAEKQQYREKCKIRRSILF